MANRFIDFDAARAEREVDTLTLLACGKTFELPGSISGALLLDVLRMEAEKGDGAEVTPGEALDILRRIMPEDVLDEITDDPGFSATDLVELLSFVMKEYAGETSAPNRAARRSKTPAGSRPRGSHAASPAPREKATAGGTSSSTGA